MVKPTDFEDIYTGKNRIEREKEKERIQFLVDNTAPLFQPAMHRAAHKDQLPLQAEIDRRNEFMEEAARINRIYASGGDLSDEERKRFQKRRIELEPGGKFDLGRQHASMRELYSSTTSITGDTFTSSYIYGASTDPLNLGASMGLATSKSSSELSLMSRQAERRRIEIKANLMNAAADASLRGDMSDWQEHGYNYSETLDTLGVIKGAQLYQKQTGRDLHSRTRNAENLQRILQADIAREKVSEDVKFGKTGSFVQESGNLKQLQTELDSAIKTFLEAIKGGAENVDNLSKNVEELTDKYKDQKQKVEELRAGGGGIFGMSPAAFGMLGEIGRAGSSALMGMGVVNPLKDMANRTGLANVVNQYYGDITGMSQGDMSATRRILQGEYQKAMAFGDRLGNFAQAATGVDTLASATDVVGSGMQTYFGGGIAGVGSIFKGAAATAISGQDVLRDITKNEARLRAMNSYFALTNAGKAIVDDTMQSYIDLQRGTTIATRGAGNNRGILFNNLGDTSYVSSMAKLGMSASEINALTSQGISSLGADFQGASAIYRAGELQKSGYMKSGDYLTSLGQLNTVGGTAANMEQILRSAVANGMDSSRNIQSMVSGISSMSASSALRGINTIAGATAIMDRSLDALKDSGFSAEMKQRMIDAQINPINRMATDSSLNLFTVAESFGLRKAAPNMPLQQLMNFQKLSVEQQEALSRDPSLASSMGVGFLRDKPEVLRNLLNVSNRNLIQAGLGLFVPADDRKAIQNAIESGDLSTLTRNQKDAYDAAMAGGKLNSAIFGAVTSRKSTGTATSGLLGEGGIFGGPQGDKVNEVENYMTKEFVLKSNKMELGKNNFETLFDSFKKLNAEIGKKTSTESIASLSEGAQGAASTGTLESKTFGQASTEFAQAVDKFDAAIREAFGIKIDTYADIMNRHKNKAINQELSSDISKGVY